MGMVFKVFTESYNIAFVLVWFLGLRGMWALSSLSRDQSRTPCLGRRSPNHWTTTEVPAVVLWWETPGFFSSPTSLYSYFHCQRPLNWIWQSTTMKLRDQQAKGLALPPGVTKSGGSSSTSGLSTSLPAPLGSTLVAWGEAEWLPRNRK